jgi:hypothetical protein
MGIESGVIRVRQKAIEAAGRSTAFHEAGHAVTAFMLEFQVDCVGKRAERAATVRVPGRRLRSTGSPGPALPVEERGPVLGSRSVPSKGGRSSAT